MTATLLPAPARSRSAEARAPRLDSLTGMRFVAALAVFVHHTTGLAPGSGLAQAPSSSRTRPWASTASGSSSGCPGSCWPGGTAPACVVVSSAYVEEPARKWWSRHTPRRLTR
ncbi:hypothetical protein [Streptomyces sp. NPDC055140]